MPLRISMVQWMEAQVQTLNPYTTHGSDRRDSLTLMLSAKLWPTTSSLYSCFSWLIVKLVQGVINAGGCCSYCFERRCCETLSEDLRSEDLNGYLPVANMPFFKSCTFSGDLATEIHAKGDAVSQWKRWPQVQLAVFPVQRIR